MNVASFFRAGHRLGRGDTLGCFRLSHPAGDLLFVVAGCADHVGGATEIIWAPRAGAPEG
jgi:hypothetical protein